MVVSDIDWYECPLPPSFSISIKPFNLTLTLTLILHIQYFEVTSSEAEKWGISIMRSTRNQTVPMMTLSCIHAASATVFWLSLTFSLPSKDSSFSLASTALPGINLSPDIIISKTLKWNEKKNILVPTHPFHFLH